MLTAANLSRSFVALILAAMMFAHVDAQQPMGKTSAPTDKKSDALTLPPNTIIFYSKDAKELQKLDAVILTREQFKELTDQLDALKKKLATDQATAPGICKLHGRLETRGPQTLVRITATFELDTNAPRSTVFLGCARSQPVSAKLDDNRLPLLASSDDGLTAIIDSAGRHTIVLELEVPLAVRGSKGTELGFEIGLPGAAITRLTFDPVPQIGAYQLTVKRDKKTDILRVPPERLKLDPASEPLALGPADSLDLTWEPPAQNMGGPSTSSAVTDLQVTIDDTDLNLVGKMRLRGNAKEWRILAPMVAELNVFRPAPTDGLNPPRAVAEVPFDPMPVILRPTDPNQPPIWKLQFKDRPTEDVIVSINARIPRTMTDTKSSKFQPIGPFAALDMPQQNGTIKIVAPMHLFVGYQLRPEVRRVETTITGEASFRYGAVPMSANMPIAPLEVEVRTIPGTIQSETRHELKLSDNGWKLHLDLDVTPIRTAVDHVDFEIPPGWENLVATSSDRNLIEGSTRDAPQRRLSVKLFQPQKNKFQLSLDAVLFMGASSQETNLKLPRVLNTQDRAGRVQVECSETLELRGHVHEWEGDQPGSWSNVLVPITTDAPRPTRYAVTLRGSPASIDLSWRTHRPQTIAESHIDLTIRDRQIIAVQQLRLLFAESPPRQIRLRGPADLTGVRLLSSGGLDALPGGEWLLTLPNVSGREVNVSWSYAFPLRLIKPNERMEVSVPLLWCDSVSRCETRLRVWRESASPIAILPTLIGGPWIEQAIEPVPERDTLPALVLHGSGTQLPLTLGLTEGGMGPLAQVWIDRVLVQMRQGEAGVQDYRARFLLRRWLTRSIDLELPAPPTLRVPEFYLDEKRIDNAEMLPVGDDTTVRIFRVPLMQPRNGKPSVLEVRYQLSAGRSEGTIHRLTRWDVDVIPPMVRSAAMIGPVRWQMAMPESWTTLDFGDQLRFEQRFSFRNGLLTVLAARSTVELDQWFNAGLEASATNWDTGTANLTARQSELNATQLMAVPRMAWLPTCSLLIVIVGLVIWRLPTAPRWIAITLFMTLLGIVSFGFPQIAAQLLVGSQIGAAVLAVVLTWLWYRQRRYRRRLMYMPGFSRQPTKSSKMGSKRGPREPSTVDSPKTPAAEAWAKDGAEAASGSGK